MKVFVVISSIFGLTMALLMPQFLVPDEQVHFYRAYQIANGGLTSEVQNGLTGGYMPDDISNKTDAIGVKIREGQTTTPSIQDFTDKVQFNPIHFQDFRTSALYSPVPYIPQAIGIAIGQIVYPSIGVMVLFGRLLNLAAFIVLVAMSIRIATAGKWVYVALGLLPMTLQQAGSLSSDVATFGLSFVFIALVLRLYGQAGPLTKKQLIWATVLAGLLALTKQSNVVIVGLAVFLPGRLFLSSFDRLKKISLIVGVALLLSIAWFAFLKLAGYAMQISGEPEVNQTLQIQYLLHHPLSFISVLLKTYIFEGFHSPISTDFLWTSMIGTFSWIKYKLPLSFIILGYIGLLFALLYKNKSEDTKRVSKSVAAWSTSVYVLTSAAIAGALYLAWTRVGNDQVWGLQGRYFINIFPLLIPLFVMIQGFVTLKLREGHYIGIIIAAISTVNMLMTVMLTARWFYL